MTKTFGVSVPIQCQSHLFVECWVRCF